MLPPAFIDVEASGFGSGSYPLEVGVALVDGSTHCFLIRPEPDWTHWDSGAEALHGVARETLLDVGRPVGEVAETLNGLLRDATVYSDGWSFDFTWLALLFERAQRAQRFRVEHVHTLLTQTQLDNWDAIRARVERELGLTRHRASGDAKILQLTYLRTLASGSRHGVRR